MTTKRVVDLPILAGGPDHLDRVLIEDISAGATKTITVADLLAVLAWAAGNPLVKIFPSGFFAVGSDAVGLGDLGAPYVVADGFVLANGGSPFPGIGIESGAVAIGDSSAPVRLKGTSVRFPSVTVAGLPAVVNGACLYVSDGRKVGEGAGAGTGVMAYGSNGAWRRPSDDSAVVA